eukprot:13389342-Alexandrium_andersonii.AAC.1
MVDRTTVTHWQAPGIEPALLGERREQPDARPLRHSAQPILGLRVGRVCRGMRGGWRRRPFGSGAFKC